MFAIPLYILLFIYLLFLVVFVIFFVLNIYHIVGSGTFTWVSLTFVSFVIASILVIALVTWQLLLPVDWSQSLIEFGGLRANVLGL